MLIELPAAQTLDMHCESRRPLTYKARRYSVHPMKPKVYVETSIPSFYHESRTEPDMVARRQWTREWWDNSGGDYLLVTSVAVLDELSRGNFPNEEKAVEMMGNFPLLPVESAIAQIVEAYIQHKVMPADPAGDALHLALASYHKCDFLLTWNCQHFSECKQVWPY